MIEIKRTDVDYNCTNCYDGKEQKEIKIGYQNDNAYQSTTITLCRKCRIKLADKLIHDLNNDSGKNEKINCNKYKIKTVQNGGYSPRPKEVGQRPKPTPPAEELEG